MVRVLNVQQSNNTRLDVYLALALDVTRSYIKQLVDSGLVLVNGKAVKGGKILQKGDEIQVDQPQKTLDILPQNIALDILYEDSDLAVINKQKGLSVHPAGGATTDTLVNALLYHFKDLSKINGTIRPGIVHRLDKDTSGVMVVAKNDKTHLSLSKQIANRSVKKIYHALLEGVVKDDSGKIQSLIGRSKTNRKKMTTDNGGRDAITLFKVLKRFESATLMEFDLKTGRTHQIRVHAKHIGHPVIGDPLYGFKKQKFNLNGQLLHSYLLEFKHPTLNKNMYFTAPLPSEFLKILDVLSLKQ